MKSIFRFCFFTVRKAKSNRYKYFGFDDWGGAHVDIFACSETIETIEKKINNTEYEYINVSPSPKHI